MDDDQRATFLLDAVVSQARVLLLMEGRAWEAHIESLIAGTVVAMVRLAGSCDRFIRREVALTSISDMAREGDEEPRPDVEDPLLAQARELLELGTMSLAERMVMTKIRSRPGGSR